jgi:hypothetical protein
MYRGPAADRPAQYLVRNGIDLRFRRSQLWDDFPDQRHVHYDSPHKLTFTYGSASIIIHEAIHDEFSQALFSSTETPAGAEMEPGANLPCGECTSARKDCVSDDVIRWVQY